MRLLLIGMMLVSCNNAISKDKPKEVTPLDIVCEEIGDGVERCENIEVICYGRFQRGLQCKFKGRK